MAVRRLKFSLLLVTGALVGCQYARQIRDPQFAELARATQLSRVEYDAASAAVPSTSDEFAGPHSVDDYILIALGQSPEVQAIRKRMEALAYRVPVAASLQDPMLTVTLQPEQVQTAAGQQEALVALSQRFPWFGKLAAQANLAEAETNVARAQLAAVELDTVAKVKKAYYDLYFIQRAIEVTEAEQQLLLEIRAVADARYQAGRTSQQDVLRADLEISTTETELIRLRQQLVSGQARLARLLHLSPQTAVLAEHDLPELPQVRELETLQRLAVTARPELHAKLAAISRSRQAVALARLDYKPDVTLGLSWIDVADAGLSPVANGQDSFLLSAGVNLPIYRKRLDSAVRSAEATAVSVAREYDVIRDQTLEEVTDLFAQIQSDLSLLQLFREDILPKARQTLEISSQAYNVDEVDFLTLVDNWRQLLRYEISYRRLEASLNQNLAELERTVGGMEAIAPAAIPSPLVEPEQVSSRR